MFRRRFGSVLCVLALAVAPALVPAPALASVSGEVTFECEIRLPVFPSPAGNGWCGDGPALLALAEVSVIGVADDGRPYLVYGVGRTAAEFTYSMACLATEPPLLGTVQGRAWVWDVPAILGGVPTTSDLVLDFSATFHGAVVSIVTSGHRIYFATGGSASGTTNGAGAATFAGLFTTSNVCPVGGPLTGRVQGEVNLPH